MTVTSATSAAASLYATRSTNRANVGSSGRPLSDSQQKQIDDLKKRDADVHEHEEAHLAAAGGFARSGAVFDYETGPDGKQYAVGGHVGIDVSPVPNDPKATIQKEQTVERAALAPADPSGQDRSVAAQASAALAKAQAEVTQQKASGRGKGTLVDVKG